MDPRRKLPKEIFEIVLKNVEAEDLKTVSSINREWRYFIDNNWAIWKHFCSKTIDQDMIEKDVSSQQKLTWKEIFRRNYKKSAVLKRWKDGKYSKQECFIEQPDDFICELEVDTWGYILDVVCVD